MAASYVTLGAPFPQTPFKEQITTIPSILTSVAPQVYVSGNIGFDYSTMTSVGAGVGDHTRQALANISTVLEEAGSSLQKIVKANVYLTDMADYAAHNKVWCEIINDPKPARTCVCVKELPFKTDVSSVLPTLFPGGRVRLTSMEGGDRVYRAFVRLEQGTPVAIHQHGSWWSVGSDESTYLCLNVAYYPDMYELPLEHLALPVPEATARGLS